MDKQYGVYGDPIATERDLRSSHFIYECINFDQIFKDILLQIRQRHFILFQIHKYYFSISEIAIVKTAWLGYWPSMFKD